VNRLNFDFNLNCAVARAWNLPHPCRRRHIRTAMDLADFRKLFAYERWANREALRSIRAAGTPARALKLLAHIVAAQALWLARLKGEKPPLPVWPELSAEECERHLATTSAAWEAYLDGLGDSGLSALTSYTNSKGEHWSNTAADVFLHVAMHGTYHRGQIASDVRASGHTPAYTDYIEGVRRRSF
jgi:uncharacterized damage-inducible protein DinB